MNRQFFNSKIIHEKSIISGSVIVVPGLLIALGPQFLFRVCAAGCDCCGVIPTCHWSAQAEIGIGMLIASLGICFIIFNDPKIQFGLNIGILFSGIIALFIPHFLIGGCEADTMACHRLAFPAITIICIFLFVCSLAYMFLITKNINQ